MELTGSDVLTSVPNFFAILLQVGTLVAAAVWAVSKLGRKAEHVEDSVVSTTQTLSSAIRELTGAVQHLQDELRAIDRRITYLEARHDALARTYATRYVGSKAPPCIDGDNKDPDKNG